MLIEKVTFEPHNPGWVKITAHARDSRDDKIVYLDNISAKALVQNALWHGQAQPPTEYTV